MGGHGLPGQAGCGGAHVLQHRGRRRRRPERVCGLLERLVQLRRPSELGTEAKWVTIDDRQSCCEGRAAVQVQRAAGAGEKQMCRLSQRQCLQAGSGARRREMELTRPLRGDPAAEKGSRGIAPASAASTPTS